MRTHGACERVEVGGMRRVANALSFYHETVVEPKREPVQPPPQRSEPMQSKMLPPKKRIE